jgi:hypothetical protein
MPEDDGEDEPCEPQHYSWDLGTPDNMQPVEIIYDVDALNSPYTEDQTLIEGY